MTIELSVLQYQLYRCLKEHPKGITTEQARAAVNNGKVDSIQRGLLKRGIRVVYSPTIKRYLMDEVTDEVVKGEDYSVKLERAQKKMENHVAVVKEKREIEMLTLTKMIIEQMRPLIVPVDTEKLELVKVREFAAKEKHDPEEMVSVITDVHVCKITPTYNPKITQERLNNYRDGLLSVLHIQRSWNPMNRLHMFMLGDILDGENLFPGHAFEVDGVSVVEQIFSYAIPMFSKLLLELAPNFKEIKVYCVPGNHGRVGKYAAKASNWDTIFYKVLEAVLKNVENIKFVYPDEMKFYIIAEVLGHKFLLTHGAEIKAYYNTPVYQWVRHSERWRSSIDRDIKYFLFGHFHTISKGNDFNGMEILAGGTFVSDDQFSIQGMAMKPSTAQLLFGVNRKHGITWEYAMDLGYKHSKKEP